tara:strand:+ start:2004 stop:2642 length:639 start_codon:yes stop_codon:yes gene_type:complete
MFNNLLDNYKYLVYTLFFIFIIPVTVIFYWCLESWVFRSYRKFTYYRRAKKLAKEKNKQLVVVGDPYSGAGTTKFIQDTMRNIGHPLYECGDFTIDITGCPQCQNKTDKSLELALKDLSDNCCVLFVSGTLEYVDADMEEMIKDMNRVSGGDMFIVTVNDMTGHYLYNFNPLANDFTETLNNPFKQKSKRIIYKAPPNYDYFDYKDNPNYSK